MTGEAVTLSGGSGVGSLVRGSALVSQHGFGVRYDLDAMTGIISNAEHDLFGHTLTGQVLVFTKPKGGVAASWALADLKQRGLAPLAIICQSTSPIFVQGALFAGIPILHHLNDDPCTAIRTGDDIEVIADQGEVRIYR